MQVAFIVLLATLGAATGFLAGLLGIGGGMLLVPFLTMIFTAQLFPREHVLHMAVATALTTILFTALSSVRAHQRRKAVRWDIAAMMAPGALAGTFFGAQLAGLLPARRLALFFAIFIGYSGVNMLRKAQRRVASVGRPLPGKAGLFGAGLGIGLISSLVGAGGAFITVPLLSARGVAAVEAIATSAALGIPIAAGGLAGYILAGWNVPGLPGDTIGYIYWPALVCCAGTSFLTAPFGARAAHALDVQILKKTFACLLIGLAAYMGWKARMS